MMTEGKGNDFLTFKISYTAYYLVHILNKSLHSHIVWPCHAVLAAEICGNLNYILLLQLFAIIVVSVFSFKDINTRRYNILC